MQAFLRFFPRARSAALFPAALVAVFAYLALRNIGQYPSVFGDEWTYSSFARLIPFARAEIPNYLYYTAYRLSNSCGDGFLECARLLNAGFLVAAAPFIYLIARQYMAPAAAAAAAVLSILAPSNTYTSYFMPEAMYYCGFWLFSWCVLRARGATDTGTVALASAVLGALAMVKVHALFLLPGYLVYLVWRAHVQRDPAAGHGAWTRRALLWLAVALATAAAVRFGVGLLYAGRNGLYLLGTIYANQAQTRPGTGVLIGLALGNLRGHLMALVLLFGMPLAAAALHGASRRQRAAAAPGAGALLAYTALMLPALIGVTALFTAIVAGSGAESGARLHIRYYDFALPLLLIVAGAQLSTPAGARAPAPLALCLGAALALLVGASAVFLLPAYTPNHIDSPALFGVALGARGWALPVLATLGALCALAWGARARLGAQLFLFAYVPAALLVGAVHVNHVAGGQKKPDDYVKAGLFAHQYLNRAETERLTIVGPDIASLFKTRFFLDNTKVELMALPAGSAITPEQLRYPNGWLLAIGHYQLPAAATRHSGDRGYTLLRVAPPGAADLYDFADSEGERMRSTGLSGIEDWGRWSDGPLVTLRFAQPLPRRLRLRLDVAAYGPNAQRDIPVSIDGQTVPLRAPPAHGPRELVFATSGAAHTVRIAIPQPTSPHELGSGPDQRKLGLALYTLQVIDDAQPAGAAPGAAK
nr:hypothetical protein [uncultured Duganella sp.]